jgi:hypothetical protein
MIGRMRSGTRSAVGAFSIAGRSFAGLAAGYGTHVSAHYSPRDVGALFGHMFAKANRGGRMCGEILAFGGESTIRTNE